MCEKKGIYVMLDFHHDLWSEKYCGEGAPAWAALEDEGSNFPSPLENPYPVDEDGFPAEKDCELHNWYDYHAVSSLHLSFQTYAFASASQNFYDNKNGTRDSFAQFWKYVAKNFKNYDNVLGYEIMYPFS
jgi:endoglycosylceramidase